MAYDTLGMIDLNSNDFAAAEQALLKAVDASKASPEAVVYLRLSVAQDKLKQYPQALDSANKAVQYAPQGSTAQSLAKQQQARVQKLMEAASPLPRQLHRRRHRLQLSRQTSLQVRLRPTRRIKMS